MYVNLTKQQQNKLRKGHNVRVKSSQLGDSGEELFLDNMEKRKYRAAVKHDKGMTIKPSMLEMLEGGSLKKVLDKVKKNVKSTYNKDVKPELQSFAKSTKAELKSVAKDIMKDLKSTAKEATRRKVNTTKERAAKKLMENNIIDEERAEKVLQKLGVPKDLAEDLVTKSNIKLRDTSMRTLDKLQEGVENALSDMELEKGVDYDIEDMASDELEGMGLKGVKRGRHRVVYLKGQGAKDFFRKVGRSIGKIISNPAVKKVVKQLATSGISSLGAMVGLPPSVTGALSKPLTDLAIDEGSKALSGLGVRRRGRPTQSKGHAGLSSTKGGAMYMSGMRNRGMRGGALYMSGKGDSDNIVFTPGKVSQNDNLLYI
jgi:hypothetical protein